MLIGILYIYSLKDKESDKLDRPKFLEYTEDKLKGWKWSWSWEQNYDKKWNVNNLTPYCPNCDTLMIDEFLGEQYRCPRCGYDSLHRGKGESSFEIEALIHDNIRRKYFNGE